MARRGYGRLQIFHSLLADGGRYLVGKARRRRALAGAVGEDVGVGKAALPDEG